VDQAGIVASHTGDGAAVEGQAVGLIRAGGL
jgi:hypothetical protein